LPLYCIFGSDELSARSPAIGELTSEPFVEVSKQDAQRLDVVDGDGLSLSLPDGEQLSLKVVTNNSIPPGCVGYSTGLPGAKWVAPNTAVSMKKDLNWSKSNIEIATVVTEQGGSNA